MGKPSARAGMGIMVLLILAAGRVVAAPPPASAPPGFGPVRGEARATIDLEAGTVRIGDVEVDAVHRKIRFPASVNMTEGILEYAVVGGQGKLHESLLRTDIEPYDLQMALLLLGLRGGDNVRYQGDTRVPQGDRVRIWVEWESGGRSHRARLERLIRNERLKGPMGDMDWVFTGSRVVDGVLMAQVERSIVAIYRDPLAIIDNPAPGAEDDTIWSPNRETVPPEGHPVTVIIEAVGPE